MSVLVQKHLYEEELEAKVKYFCNITPDLPLNEKQYERVTTPAFVSESDREAWEVEQINRCINGHEEMSGKMYFYFNFCKIKNLKGGKISPEFRVADNAWYSLVEECQESEEWGIVCVKRRRAGFSWKEAADVLHDAMFFPFRTVGMNSKTERDSIELFKKVKFMYGNIPSFLKAKSTAGNTKMNLDFSYFTKDENGNRIKRGTQSEIICVSPVVTAFEGMMLNKWVCDEAGKQPNLPQMWSYTIDCMMQETVRAGLPIIFGTSGEVGKEGRGLVEIWRDSEVHKLKRFFFGGWMGIHCDEFGNDLKEEAIRWIIYERHRLKNLSTKQYNDFLQKYPLTVDEAFSQASDGGVGNPALINDQLAELRKEPPRKKKGYFIQDSNGDSQFVPKPNGNAIVYEDPKPSLKSLYIGGCDPADHDIETKTRHTSDMSLFILSRQDGLKPPRIVFEMTYRPNRAKEYYKQAILALRFYNNAKVLIERNRFNMISFMEGDGYKHLLATSPQSYMKLFSSNRTVTIGIHMNDHAKDYMIDLIEEYVDDYCHLIPSTELLQEFIEFGSRNTDRAMAFGICLILLKEYKQKIVNRKKATPNIPSFSYRKTNDGKIIRVNKNPMLNEFEGMEIKTQE